MLLYLQRSSLYPNHVRRCHRVPTEDTVIPAARQWPYTALREKILALGCSDIIY